MIFGRDRLFAIPAMRGLLSGVGTTVGVTLQRGLIAKCKR